MLIRKPNDIRPSEITSEANYLNRRDFIRASAIAGGSIISSGAIGAIMPNSRLAPLENISKSFLSTNEIPNSFEDISTYNNFYEFGLRKSDPAANATSLKPRPWSIKVSGHAEKKGVFDFDEFMKPFDLEERIYRMRCVEAWSMVIPWVGISLAEVVKHYQPTSKAKYISFETLEDREQMPGQKGWSLDWPYREGLTIEEATNPLTILAVGLYGKVIPNQNGAPIRLVVPWKYGFKSIKSIVSIKFMSSQPKTSWNMANPYEYGFYANVNPKVNHPRWSQARERRIGGGIFDKKRETLIFNGYGEHVAHLYKDFNLQRNF
ncbi:MAG: protein-methionine-sulfoxide reductase catalytic subunit MsrP [Woeseiaceae bacterium]|nr:protein-methionine-sulfoxide reductase catalytic subunit MsrP [Woeseiaceae bacterium]